MVVPAAAAQAVRAGQAIVAAAGSRGEGAWGERGGDTRIALTIAPGAIVVSGVSDPEAAAAAVVKKVRDEIERGALGAVILQRTRDR